MGQNRISLNGLIRLAFLSIPLLACVTSCQQKIASKLDLLLPSESAIPKAIIAPGRTIDTAHDPTWTFRYAPIGTEFRGGIPYWIFRALPRIFSDEFQGHGWEHFGFDEDDHDYYTSYHGLPRGIALADAEIFLPQLSLSLKFKRVALNCSACHRGEYLDDSGRRHLVDGMPNHTIDLQSFKKFAGRLILDSRFTSQRVLDEIDQLLVEQGSPKLTMGERQVYTALVEYGKQVGKEEPFKWMEARTADGPGRIDPFNAVKYELLKAPDDGSVATEDLPSIWNEGPAIRPWHHYDGNTMSSEARNYGSALGVGGIPMSLHKATLQIVGEWTEKVLAPPAYPFPIDKARAERGLVAYRKHCALCHGVYDPATRTVESGLHYMKIFAIGVDGERLRGFQPAAAQALNDYGAREGLWTKDAFRPAGNGYLCGPLDGIWARAPYLHNGSVPNLAALLSPPEERPKKFYRGSAHYDTKNVGFVTDKPRDGERVLFEYNTVAADGRPIPGNGNFGHAIAVRGEEQLDLLEYLKTL